MSDDNHEQNMDRIHAFLMAVQDEANQNPLFAATLLDAIEGSGGAKKKRGNRRSPGVVDPFEVWTSGGLDALNASLGRLDVEQLKDIVAEHGMDRTKLAMKWKTPQRLIDLIAETVESRTKKGSAFLTSE